MKTQPRTLMAVAFAFAAAGCRSEVSGSGAVPSLGLVTAAATEDDATLGDESVPGSSDGNRRLLDDDIDCEEGHKSDSDGDGRCVDVLRLAVSDAETGRVTILNLDDASVAGAFDLAASARIYATESGRFAVAFERGANRVDFIDSGLGLEAEEDEIERFVRAPHRLEFSLLGSKLATENPVHFESHSGYVTVHFDGAWDANGTDHVPAKNIVIREDQLLRAHPEPALVLESLPQHGVSIVTESGHLLMTEPSLDRQISTLPSGVSVRDLSDGRVLQTFNDGADFQASCWGLHGEALSGPRALFGCHQALDGGTLLLSWNDRETRFESRKLQYPGYPDAPNRTSVLASHPKSPYVVGQWGTFAFPNSFYDGLVRISPTATEITDADTLELGSVYCTFGFERSRGKLVVALTRNGELHVVDVERWLVRGSVSVLPDLEAQGRCAGAMVLGKGVAYVSDTGGGSIMEVDLAARKVTRSFSVSGSPGGMALLGMFSIPGEPAH